MEIDLFTVIAQIINFLILLLLLKYLLYGRIIKAMDSRQEMIASRIQEADQEMQKAEDKNRLLKEREEELNRDREQKLREAAAEVESTRKDLMEAARLEVDRSRDKWLDSLSRQKEAFLRELSLRSGQEIYAVAREALRDLADADLEEQVVRVFLKRLGELPHHAENAVAEPGSDSADGVTLSSSFEIPEGTRKTLLNALRKRFGRKVKVSFDTTPELICGVELRVGDRRISWSLESYLSILEDRISAALEDKGPGDEREDTE